VQKIAPQRCHVKATRRKFLRNTGLGFTAALLAKHAAFAAPFDARIEILLDEPLGTISPNLYGHFTENLGGVVYDGIWVGENSKVDNVNGIRKSLVEALQKIKAPVIRWPGGCFADSYDWKDGIGPRAQRPRRTNFWADEPLVRNQGNIPQKFDPNEFGTNEFVQFCRLANSEPYFAANVRSLPALDFDHWVEYCNSPAGSTTLADLRAAGGSKDPLRVRYWGIGNESWGCGGEMTPAEYAREFRRFTAWIPGYGMDLSLIASGPNDDNYNWTRGFLQGILEKGNSGLNSIYGLSLHYYSWNLSRGRTNDWVAGKGDAVQFEPIDWYELLHQGDRLDSLIEGHWAVMSEFDPQHRVKLVVDEWGPWYKSGTEAAPAFILGQMITLRDAVFSGATLDILNRHPEKIAMANCAQLINNLNCLFLAHGDRLVATPVYHVFQMYAAHQGGQSVRALFAAPAINYDRDGKPASFWGLKGSASLKGKELTLTVVNPDVAQSREASIDLLGGQMASGRVTVLTHSDIHAHNTFDSPETVRPRSEELKGSGSSVRYTFSPASVNLLQITLA
jgi:alpha-L-arabinofuranosidase